MWMWGLNYNTVLLLAPFCYCVESNYRYCTALFKYRNKSFIFCGFYSCTKKYVNPFRGLNLQSSQCEGIGDCWIKNPHIRYVEFAVAQEAQMWAMTTTKELSEDLQSIVNLHKAGVDYRSISESLDVHVPAVKQMENVHHCHYAAASPWLPWKGDCKGTVGTLNGVKENPRVSGEIYRHLRLTPTF